MHSTLGTFYANDPRLGIGPACNVKSGPAVPIYCINLGGHPQAYAPNFTFNVGAQYAFALDEDDTLTPRVNFGHVSDQWATLFDNAALGDKLQERNVLGAQLEWAHGSWSATLYGTNLTNDVYIAAANSGARWAGPPRQVGIRITKIF
jgi:iron complex outermembrane receptor protein